MFVYHGKEIRGKALETVLFRPSDEQNRSFTALFGQAGTDPQIQRLQREYLRHEVPTVESINKIKRIPSEPALPDEVEREFERLSDEQVER